MKKIPFIMHSQLHLTNVPRAGTERATSSIIKSDQKDTEASITEQRPMNNEYANS